MKVKSIPLREQVIEDLKPLCSQHGLQRIELLINDNKLEISRNRFEFLLSFTRILSATPPRFSPAYSTLTTYSPEKCKNFKRVVSLTIVSE